MKQKQKQKQKQKRTRRSLLILGLFAIGGAVLFAGRFDAHVEADQQRESHAIALGSAQTARIHVDLGYGRVKLVADAAAAADTLLRGDFRASNDSWMPAVDYVVEGTEGVLTLDQQSSTDVGSGDAGDLLSGDTANTWELHLNPAVPTNLEIDVDSGIVELDLAGLNLTSLDVDVETGQASVDFTGPWAQAPEKLKIETTGGRIIVQLPTDVGVRVDADGSFLALIQSDDDLDKEDGDFVNDAYGDSPITLEIELDATVGQIKMELPD